jgi:hypothetical protein
MEKMDRINLYLDIDGVLHSDAMDICRTQYLDDVALEDFRVGIVRGKINPSKFNLLCPERQELLAQFLLKYQRIDVVLSSAWRTWQGYNFWHSTTSPDPEFELNFVDNLVWLKRLLHPIIASRLVGRTGTESSRLSQIREFERTYNKNRKSLCWIALDDQQANFPAEEITPVYSEYASLPVSADSIAATEMLFLVDGQVGLSRTSIAALDKKVATFM